MAEERRLLATQRDCWVVSYDDIDPTKYVPHKMATAAYARERNVYYKDVEDNRLVRRIDLKHKNVNPSEIDMDKDVTFMSEELTSDSRSYTERRLKYSERKDNEEMIIDYGIPNEEILISKVTGNDVGRVEIGTVGSSKEMWLKVKTPEGLDGERQATYNIRARNGEFNFNAIVHLDYQDCGFLFGMEISVSNNSTYAATIDIEGDQYNIAAGEIKNLPTRTFRAVDLAVKHTGKEDVGFPISFLTHETNTWEVDMPDVYTNLEPYPDGRKGDVHSLFTFASRAMMEAMYEESKKPGGVTLTMDIVVTGEG